MLISNQWTNLESCGHGPWSLHVVLASSRGFLWKINMLRGHMGGPPKCRLAIKSELSYLTLLAKWSTFVGNFNSTRLDPHCPPYHVCLWYNHALYSLFLLPKFPQRDRTMKIGFALWCKTQWNSKIEQSYWWREIVLGPKRYAPGYGSKVWIKWNGSKGSWTYVTSDRK